MGKLIIILQILGAYFLIFSLKLLHGATVNSCSQTPYPEVCDHYRGTDFLQTLTLDQTQFSFQDLTTRITMHQALKAHKLISAMHLTSFHEPAKLAWSDCLELYKDTVHHLNRSISTGNNNPSDTLAWLSAALANEQTCQNGFTDFNLISYLQSFPLMLGNFSKLLSNSLALKQAEITSLPYTTEKDGHRRLLHLSEEFPSWVPVADRRLLQSSGGVAKKADIVVAQDGSGDYRTINEAVAASVRLKKKGIKRLVIYVKKGIYYENVEIKKSMKNLMFTGDGIDATIVTGNRNVYDGFTTFRSATFGKLSKWKVYFNHISD